MRDLGFNMFYKTAFDVESKEADGDVLWSIVLAIRNWLVPKWLRRSCHLPTDDLSWSAFKTGCRLHSMDDVDLVSLESSVHWTGPEAGSWACRITETDLGRGVAPRTWRTEVSVRQVRRTCGTVCVIVSYADAPGFIGPTAGDPRPLVPEPVLRLARDEGLACTACGRPLPVDPLELLLGDFPDFWDFVSDEGRDVPVVFVSPRADEDGGLRPLVDPAMLSGLLGPAAFVFHTSSQGFMDNMRYALGGTRLGCWGGAVRVYAAHPRFGAADDARRHRFLAPSSLAEEGGMAAGMALRRALAQDVGPGERITRVEDIQEALRRAGARRRASEAARAGEEQALRWVAEAEAEREAVLRENEVMRTENGELRAAIHSLRATNASLRRAADARMSAARPDLAPGRWPLSAAQVGQVFVTACPSRMDLTERGWRTLSRCGTDPIVLWNALSDLCNVAWELHAGGAVADIQRAFNERSTFEYARGVGSMTRRDAALMEEYRDTYQGREVTCEAHIGRGGNDADPTSVRVYFCYDRVTGRIVVSHCGGHLPTYGGKWIS